jgi:hypothetical protein
MRQAPDPPPAQAVEALSHVLADFDRARAASDRDRSPGGGT